MDLFQATLLTCLIGAVVSYKAGVQYVYKYQTEISVLEPAPFQNESRKDIFACIIATDVYVTLIWSDSESPMNEILRFEFQNPQLFVPKKSSLKYHKSNIDYLSSLPVYLHLKNNEIRNLFIGDSNLSAKNLKKGIVSLFQFQTSSGKITETDVMGPCETSYSVEKGKIKKIKENCESFVNQKIPYKSVRSAIATMTVETSYYMLPDDNSVIKDGSVKNEIKLHNNLWKEINSHIVSNSELQFVKVDAGKDIITADNIDNAYSEILKKHEGSLKEESIIAVSSINNVPDGKSLSEMVKKYKKYLQTKNLAKMSSATAFYKLLKYFRTASSNQIKEVLNNAEFDSIMPQLLDILAFAQTESALVSASQILDFTKGDVNSLERYLISLSMIWQPSKDTLNFIFNILQKNSNLNNKVKETLITTLGSLVKSYSASENADSMVIQNILHYLEKQLKLCKEDSCSVSFLRGLRNAAIPSSAALLLQIAEKGLRSTFEALQALKNIEPRHYPLQSDIAFKNIFFEKSKKYDSSSRILAAELLLLSSKDKQVTKELLIALGRSKDEELTTLITSIITKRMVQDKNFRQEILNVFRDIKTGYYYSLAQKGSSVSFINPFLSLSSNATYGLDMEMQSGGFVKRSSFDITLQTAEESIPFLVIELFSNGLSSLAGESSENDNEQPTGGMNLGIYGVSLRPYIFFVGTSELMSHVWSGTASELTPALQGNFLITDFSKTVFLQNGIPVQLNLAGVISVDLSASIQISIWNRNSHSQVKNSGALLMSGSAIIGEHFVKMQKDFTCSGQSYVNFITDLEFYDTPFKTCLQMDHPDFTFRMDSRNHISVPNTKYYLKKNRRKKFFIPARSFAFHRKNHEVCSLMLSK